ncbi:MAG TPA: hypothetical protein VFZ69_09925 [Longimicrobiales bacterium]
MIGRLSLVALLLLPLACTSRDDGARDDEAACDEDAVRALVSRFGAQLRRVSLLAPDSVLERELRASYGSLVEPHLIEAWLSDPARAPGRQVSSPWPQRIEIREIEGGAAGVCVVDGEIVYVASADTVLAVSRERVSLVVSASGDRIRAYEPAADAPSSGTPPAPADSPSAPGDPSPTAVIQAYYDAIEARDYRLAWQLWGDGGAASGQGYDEFASGFAETASVQVEIGRPGGIDAAAGSRFVRVPVVIRATTRAGERQRFEGSYTLRRSVVDGATPAQQQWHIYSAEIAAR